MNIQYHPRFKDKLRKLPQHIQEKFYKQIEFLLLNIRHPSLCAKKYDELNGIWQARVNTNVRFYFKIEGDTYVLINIKYHPK